MTHTKDEALKPALVRPMAHIVGEIDHTGKVWKPVQPAPVQEPDLIARLKNPEQHYEFTDPKKANAVLMSLCQEAADALAAQQEHEPENEPYVSLASVQERTDYAVHLNHCNIGECEGVCKYLDDDCPALKHADMKAKWDRPTPPAAQRQWVGLTDDERDAIFELHHTRLGGWDHGGDEVMYDKHFEDAVAAIEAKLKEKNT